MKDIKTATYKKPYFGTLPRILFVALAPLFFVMVVPMLFVFCCLLSVGSGSVDGPAPDQGFFARRAWGQHNLHFFDEAEAWIQSSETIANDIGPVTGVAPIGGPNEFIEGFGECWSNMTLEVIGERGNGVIKFKGVTIEGRDQRLYGVDHTRWTFSANEVAISTNEVATSSTQVTQTQ